jgi:HAE1 family hydrophobic/amphiphilic exporter-1
MSLPELSIKKPVTVFMVTLIVVLFGAVSLTKLPVELYPNTSFGEISIIIQVRGGIPPTEVETLVTKPIEEAVATVSNLKQMLSISKEGESTVVLSYQPGTDMDFAALEVREKFAKVKNRLPKEIEKPVIAQFQQGDVPVMIIAATSESRTTEAIRKVVDSVMKESLKRVAGVANVEVAGGRERKILIEADQVRLAAYGIPIDEVTGALGGNNLNLLSGEVERTEDRFLVRMIGEFESVDQIKNLAIRQTPTGSMIRVKDVAVVKDSFLEASEYSRLNVRPVVTLYVQKESTKNTIKVAQDLLEVVEGLKSKLPRDIHLVVTSNQAEFIRKAIDNLQESLLKGVVLIILVFFLFLFRLSRTLLAAVAALVFATLFVKGPLLFLLFLGLVGTLVFYKKFRSIAVVTLPIPVSVIGTFIFMRQHGLTINVMTLFGLALGVGMLVDNSIVVFENILKKREAGESVVPSAIHGSQEMFLSIVASTITSVIVFLPMVFMGQELQQLYSGMAWTVVVSLLVSMVCAITLVPMMCSRPAFSTHMSGASEEDEGSWVRKFSPVERKFLFASIRNRSRVFLGCLGFFLLTLFFISRMGLEYLGSTEQNKFTTFIEMPTGTRLDVSDKAVKKVENLIRQIPEVKTVSSRIEPWSSKIYVELFPSNKRKRSVNDVIEGLRQETNKIHPAFIYFQQEEQVGTKEIILEIFGHQYEKLRELAIAIANKLGAIPGLTDAKIRMREGRPEMQVVIQKKTAGRFGLTVNEIANQIHGKMRGFRATVFHTEGKEVETISRLDEKYRKTFKDLHHLVITPKSGEPVLLDQVSDFKFGLGPSEIWRKDKNRMIQVSANIGKIPLSKVVEEVKDGLKGIPFPEDYFYRVGGDYPQLQRSSREMRLMITLVLILVYLVLASLFESFYQPLLIMVAVPLALGGATLALSVGLKNFTLVLIFYGFLVWRLRSFVQSFLMVIGLLILGPVFKMLPFTAPFGSWLGGVIFEGPSTLSVGALLGMMMLGGIVVNHSIMLVDRINFYVKKKGHSSVKAAILANRDRLRPILMTMSTTVLGLVPMAIDKTEGANLWVPLALTVIGGVVSSTLLTLLVTPAFYIISQDLIGLSKRGFSSLPFFGKKEPLSGASPNS